MLQIVVSVQGFSVALGIMLFALGHLLFLRVVLDAVDIIQNRDIKKVLITDLKDLMKKFSRR